jgi:hypothetical protein
LKIDDKKFQLGANKCSGKRFDFMIWSAPFLSYAHSKGFDDILYGYPDMLIPSKNTALDPKEEAHLVLIRKMNGLSMSALHSACRDPISFNAINNSIFKAVPQGDTHQAWISLHTIFNPTSAAQKHNLEYQFTQCSLQRDTKNPDECFAELDCIQLQLKMDHNVD